MRVENGLKSMKALSEDLLGFVLEQKFHGTDVLAPLAQSVVHDINLVAIEDARLNP